MRTLSDIGGIPCLKWQILPKIKAFRQDTFAPTLHKIQIGFALCTQTTARIPQG